MSDTSYFLVPWLQSVFVSSFTKHFDKEGDPDATVAVMLCRTSDLAGFPEIVMGAYLDFVVKFPQTTFTYVDPKLVAHCQQCGCSKGHAFTSVAFCC